MIPIYVISVKSFTERHKHIEQMAKRFDFLFEYVWKYDADELNETDLSRVGDSLAPKSASNVLKHLHAQKLFLNTSSDIALVLEDDVVLFESFFDELNHILRMTNHLPPGWLIFSWGC